ncbi:MAG: hypothetical protein ABJG41_01485 [Cyclobacteriaceae bacterium]
MTTHRNLKDSLEKKKHLSMRHRNFLTFNIELHKILAVERPKNKVYHTAEQLRLSDALLGKFPEESLKNLTSTKS